MKKAPNILLLILILLFFTSFVTSIEIFEGDTSARFIFFDICFALLPITLTYYCYSKSTYVVVKLNSLDWIVLSFGVWCALSLLLQQKLSTDDNDIQRVIILIVLYYLFKNIFTQNATLYDINALQLFSIAFLASGCLQCIISTLQLFGFDLYHTEYQFKVHGTFNNPDSLASLLAIVIPYSLGIILLLPKKKTYDRILYYLSIIVFPLASITLIFTLIRGALLATMISVIVLVISRTKLHLKIKNKIQTFWLKAITLLVLTIISIIILISLYSLKPDSANGRLLIWKISSYIIKDHPITGIGYNQFGVVYENYQAQYFMNGVTSEYEKLIAGHVLHAHSEYIHILTETGIIGISILFLIYIWIFYHFRNFEGEHAFVIISGSSLLSYFIFSISSTPSKTLPIYFIFFYLLSITSSFLGEKETVEMKVHNRLRYILILLSIALAFQIISSRHFLYHQYKQWEQARAASIDFDFEDSEKIYAELFPTFSNNGKFLFMYGSVLAVLGKYQESIHLLEIAEKKYSDPNLWITLGYSYEMNNQIKDSERCYYKASNIIPHMFYPKYRLMKLYLNAKQEVNALKIAYEITDMKVKIPSQSIYDMKSEMAGYINYYHNKLRSGK